MFAASEERRENAKEEILSIFKLWDGIGGRWDDALGVQEPLAKEIVDAFCQRDPLFCTSLADISSANYTRAIAG